jgi:hypothetical protein
MNRFYKPTPREYVSTHVDMPWEFLQGVAEQKQKGFDTAIATGDVADKLLNFEVNAGDMAGKKKVQDEYNKRIYGVTDYIKQTGDFSTASRDFTGIIRDISQDKRINVMKNAVEPHKEVMKSANKLLEEGSAPWSIKADPNFRTYDPETEELKPYNQRAGYNSVTANKNYRDQMEETVNNLIAEQYGETRVSKDGQFLITSDGTRIDRKRVEALVMDALPSIDMANYQYANDLDLLDEKTGKQKGLSRLGIANSVINERVFSSAKSHATRDPLWMHNYEQQTKNPPTQPLDDTEMSMKGKTFDLGRTTKQYKEAIPNSTKDRLIYKTQKPADIFNKEEYSQYKQFMNTTNPQLHLKMFQGKATDEEIQETYQKFKEYYDAVHLGISSNTKVRMIDGTPELHGKLTSQKLADINLYDLEHGGGIGSAAHVLNATTGEWTTFGELNKKLTGEDQKGVKISLNKEILPYNGIVLNAKENNIPEPDRFSTGYGFTVDKTGEQYIFAKPKEMLTLDEKNINKIHTNTWIPGEPEELIIPTPSGGKKAYVVFDPNMPMAEYSARRQRGEPVGGAIIAYKTKDAADRKSTNPDDMIFEPTTDVNDPIYMYQSDPATAYNNIKRVFKYEADEAAKKATKK